MINRDKPMIRLDCVISLHRVYVTRCGVAAFTFAEMFDGIVRRFHGSGQYYIYLRSETVNMDSYGVCTPEVHK